MQRQDQSKDIELGKRLCWLLRHGASQEGIRIRTDGFVEVDSILRHPKYARHYNMASLERLVANDNKQRFMLRHNPTTGVYEIRANQGHSLQEVLSDDCMERITSEDAIPMAVHGTYYRHWPSIRKQGLRRIKRNHVHFATSDKYKHDPLANTCAISGIRNDCQILIYLDVAKVLKDERMQLYISSNGVVLCSGIGETGNIPIEFFAKVTDRRTGKPLEY